LFNLGNVSLDLGRDEDARRFYSEAFELARTIGDRNIAATSNSGMGALLLVQKKWDEAAKAFERSIEMAESLGTPRVSLYARLYLALARIYQSDLAAARGSLDGASPDNYRYHVMVGLIALRRGEFRDAKDAFESAIRDADQVISATPKLYPALDTKGLSHCGLALCGDPTQIPAAKAAYRAARAVSSDAGITRDVLLFFDALAVADGDGILAEVRPTAAGTTTS
jgi:tetratricopeptide (TPR) repeat protein